MSSATKGSTSGGVLGFALWFVFVAIPLAAFLAVRLAWRGLRVLWHLPQLFSKTIRCQNGHENPVVGFWTCRCGATFSGWAFAPCPVCHRSADFVDGCAECGVSLLSPLS